MGTEPVSDAASVRGSVATRVAGGPALAGLAGPPRWHANPYNRGPVYRLAGAVARCLPRGARTPLAVSVARVIRSGFPQEHAAVRRNLARIHPHRDAGWLDQAVSRVFESFAVCFADRLSLNRGL